MSYKGEKKRIEASIVTTGERWLGRASDFRVFCFLVVVDVGCVVCELVSVEWKRRAAAAACTRRRHRRQLLAWVDGRSPSVRISASEAVSQSVCSQKKRAQQTITQQQHRRTEQQTRTSTRLRLTRSEGNIKRLFAILTGTR